MIAAAVVLVAGGLSCYYVVAAVHSGARLVQTGITVTHGALSVYRVDPWSGWQVPPVPGWNWHFKPNPMGPGINWLPGCYSGMKSGSANGWHVIVPLWIPAALLGASSMLFWRRARSEDGRCPSCGYDLAGLVGEQCPECGGKNTRANP